MDTTLFSTDITGLPEAVRSDVIDLDDGDELLLRPGPVAKRLGDVTVRMLGYNGSIPGPTLKVRQGSEVVVHVANDTDLDTTVHWHGLRLENRIPGGDVNPYLALAGMLASGLRGVEQELPLEPPYVGNAYLSDHPKVPSTLREARDLFAASAVAREALGDAVVDHYVNNADVELAAYDAAVTDWERVRGFERL